MKSVVILFLEQNPFPQHQEFPAFLHIVVFSCLVVMAIHLFLHSPSFLAVQLEARGKGFLNYFGGCFVFF